MKYIKFNNINGKKVASVSVNYAYSRYFENLRLDKGFKKSIEDRINLKSDFELTLEELEKLSIAIENKIDELLVDPKFNPFKESLRIKYPEQYSNNPFLYIRLMSISCNTSYYESIKDSFSKISSI